MYNLRTDTTSLVSRELQDLGKRTLVMGILNVTPDSFSDGGRFLSLANAVERARQMVDSGANLLDIGAESTRPGHTPLTVSQEWARLEAILPAVRAAVDVPISIDTYKAETARMALASGADIVNDVWGGLHDDEMFRIVADSGAPYVLMHNSVDRPRLEGDIVKVVRDELAQRAEVALAARIAADRIILDPGIGFGKTMEQNMRLINHLDALKSLGFPILIGTSRKSFIGHVLGLPVSERVEGTAATVALAIARGADIIRVHDVEKMVRVVRMMDAMVR